MAKSAEYKLGPQTYPRGWFIVAESSELDQGPMAVRFFGKDFALYRGESGKPIMLDAYCAHMGTHLTAGSSAMIVQNGEQIEGDSIRCPYHGWKYGPDGTLEDIPYYDGKCPKSANIGAYHVEDVMGCVMMWHDPEGGTVPDYPAPKLAEWDDPSWVKWELDHLGELAIHGQEILDNMADCQHLGPTHGAPCEYFENEFKDHVYIQRQGGWHQIYDCMLTTATWYTGPGILLSKQEFHGAVTYELIANTPVEDGVSKVWHAALAQGQSVPPSEEDIAMAKEVQAGALQAFAADFSIWASKRSALKVMQVATDGPFLTGRKWYNQFYTTRDEARTIHEKLNGTYHIEGFPQPDDKARELDADLFA